MNNEKRFLAVTARQVEEVCKAHQMLLDGVSKKEVAKLVNLTLEAIDAVANRIDSDRVFSDDDIDRSAAADLIHARPRRVRVEINTVGEDGEYSKTYLQGSEYAVTAPEEEQKQPMTAEEAIDTVKAAFLAEHQIDLNAVVREHKYGPETAKQFRKECANGFLYALGVKYSGSYASQFAIGYGEGSTEARMKAMCDLLGHQDVEPERLKEVLGVSDQEIDEAIEWCRIHRTDK